MELDHAREINGADYIHVVKDQRLFRILKEPSGFFQSATGIEEDVLARDGDVHVEVVVGREVLDYEICKIMNIDDGVANAKLLESRQRNLKQCAAAKFDESLGAIIGERTQPSAEPR